MIHRCSGTFHKHLNDCSVLRAQRLSAKPMLYLSAHCPALLLTYTHVSVQREQKSHPSCSARTACRNKVQRNRSSVSSGHLGPSHTVK